MKGQLNDLKENAEKNANILNELANDKAKCAKDLEDIEEVLRSKKNEQTRVREVNERLTREITTGLQERNRLRAEIAKTKYSKDDLKKAEDRNLLLRAKAKDNEQQISRLKNEIVRAKQHLAEAVNTLNELRANGICECDLSFREFSQSFHSNL